MTRAMADMPRAVEQVISIWIEPEVKRRQEAGQAPVPFLLRAAQVIFGSQLDDKAITIRFNDEVRAVARFKPAQGKTVQPGQVLYDTDIETIEDIGLPDDEDPNAGHITLYNFRGTWILAFDLRRNLERVQALLVLAGQYLAAAKLNLRHKMPEPALESLWSAAELAAVAELGTTFEDVLTKKAGHPVRQRRYTEWVQLGNAPPGSDAILTKLTKSRSSFRYGEAGMNLNPEEIRECVRTVTAMITHASERTKRR